MRGACAGLVTYRTLESWHDRSVVTDSQLRIRRDPRTADARALTSPMEGRVELHRASPERLAVELIAGVLAQERRC